MNPEFLADGGISALSMCIMGLGVVMLLGLIAIMIFCDGDKDDKQD